MFAVADRDAVFDSTNGAYFIEDTETAGRFYFSCRLPNGSLCTLPIGTGTKPVEPDRHTWLWDGNREKPTLSPSVWHDPRSGSVHEWHGWIRAGRMESV